MKIENILSPVSGESVSQATYDGIHKAVVYDQYR